MVGLRIKDIKFKIVSYVGSGLIYKSSVDCLMKTIQNEGLFALYKGFLPVWIRMAPWSLTFWLSFEQIRFMLGATAF
jgi:solute carrier family 25 uncoupling protein 27